MLVRTGRANGEGQHFYFYSPDLNDKAIFNDPERLSQNGKPLQLGSLQAGQFYVVAPGSLHNSGGTYTVVNDVPIATLTATQFWEVMDKIPHRRDDKNLVLHNKRTTRPKAEHKEIDAETYKNISSYIKCEDVVLPDDPKWDGSTAIGKHPFHGSDSGVNFHVDTTKNVYSCFRCDSGGSGLELVALKHGIIECHEARQGCLRGEKFREAVEAAIDDGFEIPDDLLERYLPGSSSHNTSAEIVGKRIDATTLPDDISEGKVIGIRGPPRIGKTHWSVKQLVKWGSGNYITHRYSIISHAVKIFKELGGKGAVVVEGKHRKGLCRKDYPDCEPCKLKPDESKKDEEGQVGYFQLQEVAQRLVAQHQVLTNAEVPLGYCPYYTLRWAANYARYVFTVVQNIDKINILNRKRIVIDEDPTLAYFFPDSPEIGMMKLDFNEIHIVNNLVHVLPAADAIKKQIEAKKRKMERDKTLLRTIETIRDISHELDKVRETQISAKQVSDLLQTIILRDYRERSHDEILAVLCALDEYYYSKGDDEIDLRQIVTALLVPYTKRPAHIMHSGNGYSSFHLIGDARLPLMDMDWINGSEKIVIIGVTLAELFASKIDDHPTVINISRFKYDRNYVVIPIDQDNPKDRKNIYHRQQVKLRKIIKLIAGPADSLVDRPIIVFSGSKVKQSLLVKEFGEKVHRAAEGGERAQIKNFKAGYINLAVMNAAISRGLDVDEYGVLALHDSSFSVPFWSAAKWQKEEGAEEMFDSIVADEATNSALRISPTERSGQTSHPKLILVFSFQNNIAIFNK